MIHVHWVNSQKLRKKKKDFQIIYYIVLEYNNLIMCVIMRWF